MSPATVFWIHLVLGYVAWLLFFERIRLAQAQNDGLGGIATRHRHSAQLPLLRARLYSSGRHWPQSSRRASPTFAAYGDFATGILAILALLTVRIRPLFSLFVIAFNVVGAADIIVDYYHGNQVGLPAMAGQLGATYAIPIIYVPAADDYAHRRVLSAGASSAQGGPDTGG